MPDILAPLVLVPRPVERVWGGSRIFQAFDRPAGGAAPVGESWEIYGELPVAAGPRAGKSLDELVRSLGTDLVGTLSDPSEGFPILTKWLDCNDWLSVQVHPDDRLARELTGSPQARGKTECWFFLESQGEVLHGLEPGVSPQEWARREGRDLVDGLRRVSPRPGDFLYTAAGVVHALGPGLLLYEVQQSCDLTYRLYDWDRPGLDGRPRATHREEAVRCVLEVEPEPASVSSSGVRSRFFGVERREGPATVPLDGSSFEIVTLLSAGQARTVGGEARLRGGDSCLIAASTPEYEVKTEGSWLRIWVPSSA